MKAKSFISILLVCTLALAGCASKPATPTNPVPTTAVQQTQPTATAIPPTEASTPKAEPTTAATPTVTDTPVVLSINAIAIDNQTDQNGNILISLVTAEKPGWVVVFTDNNGQPGNVLGYAPVPVGTSSDVQVPVNTKQATSKMVAGLLVDAGNIGTFEYPGADMFATEAGSNVMVVFNKITG